MPNAWELFTARFPNSSGVSVAELDALEPTADEIALREGAAPPDLTPAPGVPAYTAAEWREGTKTFVDLLGKLGQETFVAPFQPPSQAAEELPGWRPATTERERTEREFARLQPAAGVTAMFGMRPFGRKTPVASESRGVMPEGAWETPEAKDLLRKVEGLQQRMARGSTPAERQAAKAGLDRLLESYGIGIEDLPGQPATPVTPPSVVRQAALATEAGVSPEWQTIPKVIRDLIEAPTAPEVTTGVKVAPLSPVGEGAPVRPAPPVSPVAPVSPVVETAPVSATKPAPAVYWGFQEGSTSGKVPGFRMYNLTADLIDPATGKVAHPEGSTVSENTLRKFGFEPPDSVRLYHGEGGPQGAGGSGLWFTSDPKRAASFGGDLTYVDVPAEVAQQAQQAARAAGSGTGTDHVLPAQWARQAKPMEERVEAPVYTLNTPKSEVYAPIFYSHLERTITDKMPGRAAPKEILAMALKNGVKMDEMKWMGFDDWLAQQKGPVTKDDVLKFIGENRVEVREVVHGAPPPEKVAEWNKELAELQATERATREAMTKAEQERQLAWQAFKDNAVAPNLKPGDEVMKWELHPDGGYRATIWNENTDVANANRLNEMAKAIQKFGRDTREKGYMEALRTYFTPGRIVPSYGDTFDKVLRFNESPDGESWSVEVVAVEIDGTPIRGEGPRIHRTTPEQREVPILQSRATRRVMRTETYAADEVRVPAHIAQAWRNAEARVKDLVERDKVIRADIENVGYRIRSDDAAYSQYTLPGGERYREVLITLPVVREPFQAGAEQAAQFLGIPLKDVSITKLKAANAPEELVDAFRKWLHPDEWGYTPPFYGPHWHEPNVLAHVRLTDRVTPDGKKMLFVEEVQSDWHLKGRREGYQLSGGSEPDATIAGEAAGGTPVRGGVPDAPFKKDWHELVMKRVLRMAAEEGYDAVGWITGDETKKRYDLSKHISRVNYTDAGTLFAYNKRGDIVLAKMVPESEIANYIGKEVAERLLKQEWDDRGKKSLSNLDLKVGGEWANHLYDEMLPQFVQKYGKKWGMTVAKGDMVADPMFDYHKLPESDGGGFVILRRKNPTDEESGEFVARVKTEAEVLPIIDKLLQQAKKDGIAVHTAPVTPLMKQAVLYDGQKLFARRADYRPELSLGSQQAVAQAVQPRPMTTAANKISTESPMGVKTLGLAIQAEFKANGKVDLRGKVVKDAQDLASLAQVFRDPRVEVLHYIYFKGNAIIAHEGVTSREAGSTTPFLSMRNKHQELVTQMAHGNLSSKQFEAALSKLYAAEFSLINRRMQRLGADGVYMIHNHPSGDPTPSHPDLILTDQIAKHVKGFKGHVVIDSGTYSYIGPDGFAKPDDIKAPLPQIDQAKADALLTPSIPHPALGMQIVNVKDIAGLGNVIHKSKAYVTLIYTSGNDTVQAIQEVPINLFRQTKHVADYIRGRARAFGADGAFAYYPEPGVVDKEATLLINQKVLLDLVVPAPPGRTQPISTFINMQRQGTVAQSPVVQMGRPTTGTFAGLAATRRPLVPPRAPLPGLPSAVSEAVTAAQP